MTVGAAEDDDGADLGAPVDDAVVLRVVDAGFVCEGYVRDVTAGGSAVDAAAEVDDYVGAEPDGDLAPDRACPRVSPSARTATTTPSTTSG